MIGVRILAMSIAWIAISSSLISAHDLSRYREFQLGMSLVALCGTASESGVRRSSSPTGSQMSVEVKP